MRKTKLLLSLGAICVAVLSGCKTRSKYRVPTTPYAKVSVAFDGVESSFSNYKTSEKTNSSKTRSIKRVGQSDPSGALTEIASLYKSSDSQGDKIDELGYDAPPMVQFQYLKKVFDTIGNKFSFNTKYTDTVHDIVYFDPTTGEKKDADLAYSYDYDFTISILINIDENDLITADCAFKIDLNRGETTIESTWYVSMILDYEMAKESPTYTLSVYTDNEENEFEYVKYGYTYEYDFVDMKAGRVNEWRKFFYEANQKMVKDETHKQFSDYLADPNFKTQIGASKWYKNADLREISHPNTSKTKSFIGALFDKFGLNTTDINAQAFTSKAGVQHKAINNVYQEFARIANDDLIYRLITGTIGREEVKASIKVMDASANNEVNHILINEDTELRTLLSGEEENYSIWYFDKNDEHLEQIEDLNLVKFRFSIPYGMGNDEMVYDNAYLDEKISALYESLGKENYEARHSNAILRISDGLLNTVVQISVGSNLNDQIELYFRSIFPEELLNLGFPKYEGEKCLFDYTNDEQIVLDVSQTTSDELDAFKAMLENSGWSKEERSIQTHYSKLTGNRLRSIDIESLNIKNGSVRMFLSMNDVVLDEWPRNDILTASNNIFDLEEPESKNGYFDVDLENHVVSLKNFTELERSAFISTLKNSGDFARTVTDGNEIKSINVRYNSLMYSFELLVDASEIVFSYKVSDELTYHLSQLLIEDADESVTGEIELNEDYTGYYLKQDVIAGVYKIKQIDLVTLEETYLPVYSGLDLYENKILFDASTNELTVLEDCKIAFYVNIEVLNGVELIRA